jgi:hypothetical protein
VLKLLNYSQLLMRDVGVNVKIDIEPFLQSFVSGFFKIGEIVEFRNAFFNKVQVEASVLAEELDPLGEEEAFDNGRFAALLADDESQIAPLKAILKFLLLHFKIFFCTLALMFFFLLSALAK